MAKVTRNIGVISLVVLSVVLLLAGCAGKEGLAMAKSGDTVRVHYTGTLADGTEFDTSREREPLEFTMGEGRMIPGFEDAVIGMKVGQTKTVTILADDAYGEHHDELMMVVERANLPQDMDPIVGQRLQMERADGQTFIVVVAEVHEDTIVIDANPPLAGKDLTFEIELVEIVIPQELNPQE